MRLQRLKRVLNVFAGMLGAYALYEVVLKPLYELVYLGLKPHGTLAEDFDFYYTLVATIVWKAGQYLGLTFCILGMMSGMGSWLGFRVDRPARAIARAIFWITPIFCFCGELLGRYLLQAWYAEHGIRLPSTSFLLAFVPHFWWLCGTWVLTAPAILTGKGTYLIQRRDLQRHYADWRAGEKKLD